MTETARPLKPWRCVAGDWRGARVVNVNVDEDTITLSVRAEQHLVREYEVARSLYLDATIDAPCIVRILNVGAGCDNYIIGEIRSAGWAGTVHSSVRPSWAHVDYSLTGEDPYYAWTED